MYSGNLSKLHVEKEKIIDESFNAVINFPFLK